MEKKALTGHADLKQGSEIGSQLDHESRMKSRATISFVEGLSEI